MAPPQPAFSAAVKAALDLRDERRPSATTSLHAAPFLDFANIDQYRRLRPPEKARQAVSRAEAQPHTSTMETMRALLDSMPLLAPARESGLPWSRDPMHEDVKLCECVPLAAARGAREEASARAATKMLALLDATYRDGSVAKRYSIDKTVLCLCRPRSMAFTLAALKLSRRAADTDTFGLADEMNAGVGALPDAAPDGRGEERRKVLERFFGLWPSLWTDRRLSSARVWLVYHTPPNEEIARKIMIGGFANLGKRDAGFYGSGIYVTLDLDYCLSQYATGPTGASAPLIVCALAVGVAYPVVEHPNGPSSFLGKPIVNKADTHIIIVSHAGPDGWWYPCSADRWGQERTFTELVAQNDSQVLPLGYLMVSPKATMST